MGLLMTALVLLETPIRKRPSSGRPSEQKVDTGSSQRTTRSARGRTCTHQPQPSQPATMRSVQPPRLDGQRATAAALPAPSPPPPPPVSASCCSHVVCPSSWHLVALGRAVRSQHPEAAVLALGGPLGLELLLFPRTPRLAALLPLGSACFSNAMHNASKHISRPGSCLASISVLTAPPSPFCCCGGPGSASGAGDSDALSSATGVLPPSGATGVGAWWLAEEEEGGATVSLDWLGGGCSACTPSTRPGHET